MDKNKASQRILRQLNKLHPRKVRQIRSALAKGRYKIDSVRIAKALFALP